MTNVATKAPRWMKVTLAISLALNLMVVGAVTGARLGGGPMGERAEAARMSSGGPLARALLPEDREALRASLRATRDGMGDPRRAYRESQAEILALLRADPFDADALETVLDAQRGAGSAMAAAGHLALMERIAQMTPAERAAYADRVEKAQSRRAPPRHERGGERRP